MALILGPFSSPTTLAVTEAPASCSGVASTRVAVDDQDRLEGDLGPHGLAQQLARGRAGPRPHAPASLRT